MVRAEKLFQGILPLWQKWSPHNLFAVVPSASKSPLTLSFSSSFSRLPQFPSFDNFVCHFQRSGKGLMHPLQNS